MAKPTKKASKSGGNQTRKFVLIGGSAVVALSFAIYMVAGGGNDGPKLDPQISAKAEQLQKDLKAVNPDPSPAPPPPSLAPGAPEPGTPGGGPRNLRDRKK